MPAEWADKYRGRFDQGSDRLREETFARQKQLGVIPEDAELTARHAEIPAWDEMPDDLKPVLARQMEIYAGFLEHTDHHVGRLIDAIDDLGVLGDTLIFNIIGDNGASAEGTLRGCFNNMTTLTGIPGIETTEFLQSKLADFGTPRAYNHYAVGWAPALCTPYQWTKQIASHWGGTRNGTIVHWPNKITGKGETRHQLHHVIDVAPTLLEAANLPAPAMVNSITQAPLEGVSILGSFTSADAPETHDVQYFEMFGNRGLYHQGWTAVTRHNIPWTTDPPPAFDDDTWELCGPDDWTQAHNIIADHPDKLAELQRLWLIEATKYNVLPLDDRRYERINPELAGRPQLVTGKTQLLFNGMRVTEASVINIKNRSHSVTAQVVVPDSGAQGVIVTQGGQAAAGPSTPSTDGSSTATTSSASSTSSPSPPSPSPPVSIRSAWSSPTTAAGWPKAATSPSTSTASRSAKDVPTTPSRWASQPTRPSRSDPTWARRHRPTTAPRATPSMAISPWVQMDVGDDDHDRLITPEERFNLAMARH